VEHQETKWGFFKNLKEPFKIDTYTISSGTSGNKMGIFQELERAF
jgi:hypothetical protein